MFVALAVAAIVGCNGKTEPTLIPSSAIQLEVRGVRPHPGALFGLSYAFAHGFRRVDLNGNTYLQVSPGVIFRTSQQPEPVKYRVVLNQVKSAWFPDVIQQAFSPPTLQLFDSTSGLELASFPLPSDGWPGDKAGEWLAKLLNPDPSKSQAQQFDVSSAARIELLSPSSLLSRKEASAKEPRLIDCPAQLSFHNRSPDHGGGELRSPNWTVLLPYGFREAHCSSKGVILIAAHRQEDLGVIVIDQAGTIAARGVVLNDKLQLGHRYHHTKLVSVNDEGHTLILRQAHFTPNSPLLDSQLATYEMEISIPWAAIRLPRPSS